MPRAIKTLARGEHRHGPIADTLILNLDQRRTHRGHVFTGKGVCIELDLEPPIWLRTDDVLVLEDGSLIEVVAEAEALLEVRTADLPSLARIAWLLGDRHVPVQILANRLRLRRDPAIETLLSKGGAKVTPIEAPFDPEGGAYAAADHGPHDDHADHGHAHRPHDHNHDHDHHHHHGHGRHEPQHHQSHGAHAHKGRDGGGSHSGR
jgi:urease accessory protein